LGDQAGVLKLADRDEHDLKSLEFYFMEVHGGSCHGVYHMEVYFAKGVVDRGLHDDKKMDLCGVSYRQADTQRDELTRCYLAFACRDSEIR
jgi:hypothetical protein